MICSILASKLAQGVVAGLLGLLTLTFAGCLRSHGGTWYFESAETPEGWPSITPVGKVEIKTYPVYRAAAVRDAGDTRDPSGSLFMTLFNHIQKNDIAMTAPVDMSYGNAVDASSGSFPRVTSMAFLYRSTDLGRVGRDGAVTVEDVAPRQYASVGVRGDYNARTFQRGLKQLESWLSAHPEWKRAGEPRFLGYNGPFVPPFWRYGEVQIPVEVANPG